MALKKRFTNLGSILNKRPSGHDEDGSSDADTPEANAARGVRLFCESGAANSGEEVLHLPTIVESAVASPQAASAACNQIRKFLSKENYSRPHVQYNAVMLVRILADNPGPSFTKNMDKQFADTVKHLLRSGQDPSVAQILKETLESLEKDKAYDSNLNTVFAMWRKEKGLMASAAKSFGPRTMTAPSWTGTPQQHGGFGQGGGLPQGGGGGHRRTLPSPVELAGRIEEARTSAKLLLQLVQSTPPSELLGNELVKEFSERCMSAQRSIQGYINCDSPPPDDDTMLTLIETNEQLSLAASKHQRAVLQARRLQGPTPSPPISTVNSNTSYTQQPTNSYNPTTLYQPQPQAPPRNDAPLLPALDIGARDPPAAATMTFKNDLPPIPQAGVGSERTHTGHGYEDDVEDNPFADHNSSGFAAPPGPPPARPARDDPHTNGLGPNTGSPEPYHPGYQSTPSYLGRQESSGNNLTMHGASQPPLTEEDEYARDYPATPQRNGRQRAESDVSPIAERGAVTYRY